jgi:hypothetical protein
MSYQSVNRERAPRRGHGIRILVGSGVVAVLAAGGGIAASAASGGAPSSSTSTTESTIVTSLGPTPPAPTYTQAQRQVIYQNQLKLAACMQANGYPTFPDPNPNFGNGATQPLDIGGPNGGNIDVASQQYQSALQACTTSADPEAVPSS